MERTFKVGDKVVLTSLHNEGADYKAYLGCKGVVETTLTRVCIVKFGEVYLNPFVENLTPAKQHYLQLWKKLS